MVPRRSLVVFVAVALVVIAGVTAFAEVHSAQKRAYHNAPLRSVYVVAQAVSRDEAATVAYDQGLITTMQMPSKYVPADAVTSLAAIHGQVAASSLAQGEVVVAGMFAPPQSVPSVVAEALVEGDVSVTVSVDQTHGVAGLVQPGDDVDILLDIDGTQESYLAQSVPVLAVGTDLASGPADPAAAAQGAGASSANDLITFAVPPAAAERIALAAAGGDNVRGGLYLALDPRAGLAAGASTVGAFDYSPGLPAGEVATGNPSLPTATPPPGGSPNEATP